VQAVLAELAAQVSARLRA